MVSGPSAGKLMEWDIEKSGPIIRVAEHPDFLSCRACRVDEVSPQETFHQVEYEIHELRFGSGHRHYLAAPRPMRVVDLMNVLWDGYKNSRNKS